jgi:hypothetical protein
MTWPISLRSLLIQAAAAWTSSFKGTLITRRI